MSVGIPKNNAAKIIAFRVNMIHRGHHHTRLSRAIRESVDPVTTQTRGNTIVPVPATTLSLNRNSVSGASEASDIDVPGA